MTSQTGKQITIIHMLPNISRSKGNQKNDQLMEYNMRNSFLQKSWKKWGRGTSSIILFVFSKSFIWDILVSTLVSIPFCRPHL